MKRKWLIVSLIVLVVLVVVAYFGIGYVVYAQMGTARGSCDKHMANRPDRYTNLGDWPEFDMSPFFMADYEEVRFPSRETNFDIAGWYVRGEPDKPAVILLDGIGGCKNAQAALVPAGMLARNGFNVLLIDLHETGDSAIDDGYSTIGNDEYLDVLGAWDWLREVHGFDEARIGIAANSLGAATSFYAFVEEPRVAAIFLNSPFANLPQILDAELKRNSFPTFLGMPALSVGSLLTGQNLWARSPLDAITHTGDRPIFVVHSADDKRISIDHSYQLEKAANAAGANATFWYIDGVDHVRAPAVYTEEYEAKLVDFFTNALVGE